MGKWEFRFTVAAGPIYVEEREYEAETSQKTLNEWGAEKVTEFFKKGEGYWVNIEAKPVKEEKHPSKLSVMLDNIFWAEKEHKWMHSIPTATQPMKNFCRKQDTGAPMQGEGGGVKC